MKCGLYRRDRSPNWWWQGRFRGHRVRLSLATTDARTARPVADLLNACLSILDSETLAGLQGRKVPAHARQFTAPPAKSLGLHRPAGSTSWRWRGTVRGVRLELSLQTEDRQIAERQARLYRACIAILNAKVATNITTSARPRKKPATSLEVVLEAYLARATRDGRQASTLKGYRHHVRTLLRTLGQEIPAKALTGAKGLRRLRQYVDRRTRRGVSGRTIRAELRTLTAAWSHAQGTGLVPPNASLPPTTAIEPARQVGATVPIFAGHAELDRFAEVCEDVHLRDFLLFTRWTGMRPSEVERVRWVDVDLERGTLRWVDRKAHGPAGIARGKVRALTHEAIEFLRSLEGRCAPGRPGHPFVTASSQRARWHEWSKAHPAFRDARYLPRALRHWLNSHLLDAGLPTKRVQAFLGHASDAMTLHRYAEAVRSVEEVAGHRLTSA